ncbi:MAG: calcium-binding EGF-like domain-containing protein [Schleiferiaceae bacterium]|jgi:hypothetical protein|tara:strand:- start:8025 stop:8519 length:495 start_codon:yes stop_codon:yes gene_type:complete
MYFLKAITMKTKTFFLLGTIFLTACVDPCVDKICLNGGSCLDGSCVCPDFYEGDDCGTEEREKYFATYSGTTTYTDSQGNSSSYADSKVINSNNQGVTYFNIGAGIYANLTTSKSGVFEIPSQAGADTTSYFSGSGAFTASQIDYSITVESSGQTLTMSFTGTK